MPKQACYSARPGTILGYKGRVWKITRNQTMDRRLTIQTIDAPYETKVFSYQPGQEIDVRWVPFHGPKI